MNQRMVTPRFLLVMGATLAYYLSVGILVPVLPVFIENGLASGEAMIGIAAVAFSMAAVLSRPAITWVGNRFGRRSMMVWGGVLGGVAAIAHVMVSNPWQLLPLRALMGIGEAALFVGASTVIIELSPPHRRAEAASYLSLSVFGGLSVGPIVGELLMGKVPKGAEGLDVGRFDSVFVVMAIAALLAAVVSTVAPKWGSSGGPVETQRFVWFQRDALLPGIVLAGGVITYTAFSSFVPTYAKEIGLGGAAPFFTAYSVLCLIIRFVGAKWPEAWGLRRSVAMAMTSLFAGTLVIAVLASEAGIWIGTLLMGFGMSFLYPSLLAMSVQRVSDVDRVAVVSSFTMFFEIGAAVGGFTLGMVGEEFGKRSTFLVGSLFAAAAFVMLVYERNRHVARRAVAQ